MVWLREDFLEDIGLAPRNGQLPRLKKTHLDKAEIDPRSLGAVAMISESSLNEESGLEELDLRYWAVHPTGRYEKQHLFQLETETLSGGIDIKRLWVLGREIDLSDTKNVENVLEAIRRVHISLRQPDGKLPNVAQIFEECRLEQITGERLPLPGFDKKHGLSFPATTHFNRLARGEDQDALILPLEVLRPLSGAQFNSLDVDYSFFSRDFQRARGAIPQVGKRFEMISKLEGDGATEVMNMTRRAIDNMQACETADERNIGQIRWSVVDGEPEMGRVESVKIIDRNVSGFAGMMSGFGVVASANAEILKDHDYPHMQDHLARYGLLDTAETSSAPPTAKGRFVLTSEGGNNVREIYSGVGEDIGGNCKIAETQWLDEETGETRKLGVILDFGAYLIRDRFDGTAAVPDVVEKLKYCKHICITHHHLDHLDAVVTYAKRGLLQGITLHMTREVYEMTKDKLHKMDVPQDRWPICNLLDGTGAFDLEDEKGVKRMTVMYAADAVPHSARCTPFTVYGRNGKEILGSYTYLGDMRYDEEWMEVHNSEFWDPVGFMHRREPELNVEHLLPTYAEIDLTSVKQEGKAPTERIIEDNLVHIFTKWLYDKHVGAVMIGTADGRRERLLRVGNRSGRFMTAFGAAVEFIYRIANKHGVNPYLAGRPAPGKYTGLKDYLVWHARQLGIVPSEFLGRTSKKVKEWFSSFPPGSILAVLSGSQGNPIEIESMSYKLAERRSFWDADPRRSKTARPANLKDWALVFVQGTIPGNGKYRRPLVKNLAARGAAVLDAFGDNTRVHNQGFLKERIVADLEEQGKAFEIEADGSILVPNMPIHASGHGRREDFRLWLRKVPAKIYGGHHTDDREAALIAYDTIEAEGKRHPGALFENHTQVEITTDSVRVIGRRHPSIVMTKVIAEVDKPYNKQLEASRYIVFDDRSPHYDLGLRGSGGGAMELHFGVEDPGDIKKKAKTQKWNRIPENRSDLTEPKPLRADKGMARVKAPEWQPLQHDIGGSL